MNMKIIAVPALILSLAFSPVLMANTQSMHDEEMGMMSHSSGYPCLMKHKIAKELGLSTEQQAKIKAIKMQARDSMRPKVKELIMVQHQINKLTHSDKLDQGKLDQLTHEKTRLVGEITKHRAMVKHEIYRVLTPAQRQTYDHMVKQWESRVMTHKKTMSQGESTVQ